MCIGMVKLFLCLIKHHIMKAMGWWRYRSTCSYLGTGWRWEVKLTARPLHTGESASTTHWIAGFVDIRIDFDAVEGRKISCSSRMITLKRISEKQILEIWSGLDYFRTRFNGGSSVWSAIVSDFHSGGVELESRQEHRVYRLRYYVVTLSPTGQIP